MRAGNVVTRGLSAIVLISALIVGCSKNSSGPSNPITNPEFNYMVAQTNETVDSLVALSDLGLDMTVAVSNDILTEIAFGPMPVDSSSITNLWHIFVLTNSASGVTNSWIDSVQFLHDGAAQQEPVGANEMQYVRNWSSVATDTTASYKNIEARTLLNATNTDGSSAQVSGQFDLAVMDVDKSGAEVVVRDLTVGGAVVSYAVDRANGWNSGCPTSAEITMGATLSVTTGDAAPVVSTWTYDVTFDNGETIVTVTQDGARVAYHLNVCAR
jgi:hypothetical protein